MDKFVCFIKYKENKFDIVVNGNTGEEITLSSKAYKFILFEELFGKIVHLFNIVLRKNLDVSGHVFELTDSVTNKVFVITSEVRIRHLSVITVRERPIALSRGRVSSIDVDVALLERQTNDFIAFYLMVDTIITNFWSSQFSNKRNRRNANIDRNWHNLSNRAVQQYPNIFFGYSAEKCRNLFNSMSNFYINKFDKLNLKLDPKLQKNFDMLKLINLLYPNKVFDPSSAAKVQKIIDCPDNKDSIHLHFVHSFDMCLNTNRMFKQSITYEEFTAKYIDNEPQSIRINDGQTFKQINTPVSLVTNITEPMMITIE